MNHWLIKTEPSAYSWQDMERDGKTVWNGVRNYQARNHLKAMKVGDLVLFYHSGDERSVVGMVRVTKEFYPDPTSEDPGWVVVDLEKVKPLMKPVSLLTLRLVPELKDMVLLRQGRLSVSPLTKKEFETILKLAETKMD